MRLHQRLNRVFNWRYALGELSLIVLGVLIALAANSWWENKSIRQRESAYLQQLLSDVQETERRLEYSISEDSTIQERIQRLSVLVDTATVSPAVDSVHAWAVVDYRSFQPVTGTYEALIHNAGPQLVSNDSLRLHIISYAAEIASAREVLRHTETLIWRNLERLDLAFLRHSLLRGGEKRWRASLDVDAFVRDPDLINTVHMQNGASMDRVIALRKLRTPTSRLRRLLEEELATRRR